MGEWEGVTHISGSFCVSITAAIGMPKLEAGPQKSVRYMYQPISISFTYPVLFPTHPPVHHTTSHSFLNSKEDSKPTCRADIVQNRLGADFRIEG